MKNISKNSEFFWVETLTKILSACKISSKNDIRTSRGKRKTKSVLQNVFGNNIFGASIFFLRLPRMLFLCENLEALKTFVKVYHKKNSNLLNFFPFSFEFTVHPISFELGSRRTLLLFEQLLVRLFYLSIRYVDFLSFSLFIEHFNFYFVQFVCFVL